MDVEHVILTALAVWQVVEICHHSKIALPLRRLAGKYRDRGILPAFFSQLYSCPFCLSHWVSGLLVIAVVASWNCPQLHFVQYVVWALAVTRAANLGNDLAYNFSRTPRVDDEEPDDDISVDDTPADDQTETSDV